MAHLQSGNSTAFAMYSSTGISNSSVTAGTLSTTANSTTLTYAAPAVYTTTYGGSNISNQFIGWDEQIKSLEKIGEKIVKNSGTFPPYNVIKEDENTFLIEFAVAGFSKKDISVEQEKNALVIIGSIEDDKDKKYVHKGIATRSFTRAFALAEYVEVQSATFEDGILTVKLVRELPKEEQPRQITIK
jgi:molecular chaperone IbpA